MDRRDFLASGALLLAAPALAQRTQQRVVVLMFDGFGLEYLDQSHMPVLARWRERSLFRRVKDTMPSVTNANNASICCGVLPEQHGITGNSYFDERAGREEYMETADLLLAPTLFQRAKKQGVKSALLSCKKKTTTLLSPGADLILSAETPAQDWVDGSVPPRIYTVVKSITGSWRPQSICSRGAAISAACTSTRLITRCILGPPTRRSRRNILLGWTSFSARRLRLLPTRRFC